MTGPFGPQKPRNPGERRIRRLAPTLIDQIAAGEVVERPASVVKELVENALDAGAGRVRVELREGGAAWIAVSDDGCGMRPEEARLALERHATSKLAGPDDLRRIDTFGFRGEALPAIASVSRLRLRSRPPADAEAWEIQVESGDVQGERAAAGPPGTRVEVADLFAAVPARRKFLKSAATEWGHAVDWLARIALALPEVRFDVQREGREAIAWPAVDDPLERIAAVLSEEQAASLVPVGRSERPLEIRGYASRPDHHRTSATGLHLFVNGRPVRDRLLRHAVLEAYRDWLPRGRFPTALLFVDVPLDAVDVNVHPAKWEVRFADPRALHRLVSHALSDAIGTRRWLAGGGEVAPTPERVRPRAGVSRARRLALPKGAPATGSSRAPAALGPRRTPPRRSRCRPCASPSCGSWARFLGRTWSWRGRTRSSWWTSTRPTSACCTSACARAGSRAGWSARRSSPQRPWSWKRRRWRHWPPARRPRCAWASRSRPSARRPWPCARCPPSWRIGARRPWCAA